MTHFTFSILSNPYLLFFIFTPSVSWNNLRFRFLLRYFSYSCKDDDYDDYTVTDTANVMGEFDLAVLVYYVDETSPYDASGTRTFIKRVDISITNESLPTILEDFPNTLFFKKLISY